MDGAKLNYWRRARVLTVRQLAEKSGVGHSAISLMERGKREPHPSTLAKLAAALEIEPKDLLRDPHA